MWILAKDSERKIVAFERKCYRNTTEIRWPWVSANKELYTNVEPKNLLEEVIPGKLQLLGHVWSE